MNTQLESFEILGARLSRSMRRGALILSTLLLLQGVRTAEAQVYTLDVPGSVAWKNTGIYVNAGSVLDITASGTVVYGPESYQATGPNGTNWDGAVFMPTTVLENTVVISLIGKIGGTTEIGTGTPVPEGTPGCGAGYVGAAYHKVIPISGELFLGFNDLIGSTIDNSGAFSVTVTVPEPSSAALAGIASLVLFARSKKTR